MNILKLSNPYYLTLLLIFLVNFTGVEAATEIERNALMNLYNATDGIHWKNNTNWGKGDPCANQWFGIECLENGVVDKIILSNNKLMGQFSNDINKLTLLSELILDENQLSGKIPDNLGDLVALTILNLAFNQLSGTIPSSIGHLSKLEGLFLINNKLSGTIPNTIGNLPNLLILGLGSNQLTGNIPINIGNPPALIILTLDNNQLTGNISDVEGNLSILTILLLNNNLLTGPIPDEMGELTNLVYLGLQNNQFSGNIPASLGNLNNLEALWLSNNQLTGAVPETLANISGLFIPFDKEAQADLIQYNLPPKTLVIDGNKLSGTIPEKLKPLITQEEIGPTHVGQITSFPYKNKPVAIILAGKDEANPALTKSVNVVSNFAYRALRHKGLPKESILYFNYNKAQNPDKQGGNDVYNEPNNIVLKEAITRWAAERMGKDQPLFLYMAGHGLANTFVYGLSNTTESSLLKANELDNWLDEFQAKTGNPVVVIYDACYSATFLEQLKATGNQKRINITSAEKDKLAFFGASGQTSFSFMFWANTLKGQNIKTTFTDTLEAMRSITSNSQKPQMDDNADGIFDSKTEGAYAATLSIGQSGITAAALPIITELNIPVRINNQSQINISAKVNFPAELIGRVWVSVVSPTLPKNNEALVGELEEFTLIYNNQTKQYNGIVTGLIQNGQYQIVAFAELNDNSGFISLPKLAAVIVQQNTNPRAKVVINNDIQVLLPNATFAGANYQAALRLLNIPNETRLELINNSLAKALNPIFISAVVEQASFDISIPSINIGDKNYRAFLEFVPNQTTLQWKVVDLQEN